MAEQITGTATAKPPIVLVVEDEDAIRNMLKMAIERMTGAEVHEFASVGSTIHFLDRLHGDIGRVKAIVCDDNLKPEDKTAVEVNHFTVARFHSEADSDPQRNITRGSDFANEFQHGRISDKLTGANKPYFILFGGLVEKHNLPGVDCTIAKPRFNEVLDALSSHLSKTTAISAATTSDPGFVGKFGQKSSTSQLGA